MLIYIIGDDMSKKLFGCTLAGFIFVSVLGSLAHFFYEWSGYNFFIGLICPVNESSWEHLKLLFFPYLTWAVIEYCLLGKEGSILPAKLIGVITGMTVIITFFYTYTGIIGKNIDVLNILSFFLGCGAAFAVDSKIINKKLLDSLIFDTLAIAGFIGIGLAFIIFTILPPLIPLFKDPITSTYGI